MSKMVVLQNHTLFAGDTGSGATLSANAQLLAESPAAADHFTQQALDILVSGHALAVSLVTTDAADGGLPVVGSLLRDAAIAANADVAGIALTVRSRGCSLPMLWRARCDLLGAGPLFVTQDAEEGVHILRSRIPGQIVVSQVDSTPAGIEEVWLVDPVARTVIRWSAAGPRTARGDERLSSTALPGLSLSPGEIFGR